MAEEWTVLRLLRWTEEFFREKGIAEPRLDAQALLADLLGLDRVGLYMNYDRPLATAELADFKQRVSRRGKREPLQYILGRAEFWSLSSRLPRLSSFRAPIPRCLSKRRSSDCRKTVRYSMLVSAAGRLASPSPMNEPMCK